MMHNSPVSRRGPVTHVRVALLVASALASLMAVVPGAFMQQAQAATPAFVALPQVLSPAQLSTAHLLRPHQAGAAMSIELVLAPNHQAQMAALAAAQYDPGSAFYHHWLGTGEFDRMFGSTPAQLSAIDRYMHGFGLQRVASNTSAFLVDYIGTTAAVQRAFRTQINDYQLRDGRAVFANATAPQIPAALSGTISGIIGLDDVAQAHTFLSKPQVAHPHFGGAPGTFGGLTPQQIRSIYDALPVYPRTNGNGQTVGVFELSNWQLKDVQTYEKQFGLYNTNIQSIYVDGGPKDGKAAVEVTLDVDMFLALAPGVRTLYVYNAPNTTQGYVDELARVARDNRVSVLSISWGSCESDTPQAQRNGEELYLKQMAMQGQSVFASAGDTGAFDCEYLYTTNPKNPPKYANAIEVDEPADNPYVTAVGGTSFFQTFDPGSNKSPRYPTGKEYVWNTLDNCSNTNSNHCAYGASGGGNSMVYGRYGYQTGPGTISSYTQYGSYCHDSGGPCRALPDVSINADPNSGYGIYCTDARDSADCTGWTEVAGTSAAAPLWAAIATLGEGWHGHRLGALNWQLYVMLRLPNAYTRYFHDMSGATTITYSGNKYTITSNGHFPVTPGYDMATGIGTPDIYQDVVGF